MPVPSTLAARASGGGRRLARRVGTQAQSGRIGPATFAPLGRRARRGRASRLAAFAAGPLYAYHAERDRPDRPGSSRLSPHLSFGEISPRAAWAAAAGRNKGEGAAAFLRELGWREFARHLVWHWPRFPQESFRAEFRRFPWRDDSVALECWQRGKTGYPLVDAGMRELKHTGWMHNRVRMVAASFLVKHLLVPWQQGACWFWDTLVDADLANNSVGWQWVAGSGADAAPYFRVFNPLLQARKFDPGRRLRAPVGARDRLAANGVRARTLRRAGVCVARRGRGARADVSATDRGARGRAGTSSRSVCERARHRRSACESRGSAD